MGWEHKPWSLWKLIPEKLAKRVLSVVLPFCWNIMFVLILRVEPGESVFALLIFPNINLSIVVISTICFLYLSNKISCNICSFGLCMQYLSCYWGYSYRTFQNNVAKDKETLHRCKISLIFFYHQLKIAYRCKISLILFCHQLKRTWRLLEHILISMMIHP